MYILEKTIGIYWQVLNDSWRSNCWRLRGAKIGKKVRIGKRCIVERPWCLTLGDRVLIEPNNYIKIVSENSKVLIGKYTFLGFGTELNILGNLTIGDNVLIGPGCFIVDHNHLHSSGTIIASQGCQDVPIFIEDDVWIGAKVVILPGVTIKSGAVIAAGAVVNRNVDSMSIVAGIPAKLIGKRN